MATTGSQPSATVRYLVLERNPVCRNVVTAATPAGSVTASLTETGTQQVQAERCTEQKKLRLRFRLATRLVADRSGREWAGVQQADPRGNGDVSAKKTSASSGEVAEATSRAAFQARGSSSGVRCVRHSAWSACVVWRRLSAGSVSEIRQLWQFQLVSHGRHNQHIRL